MKPMSGGRAVLTAAAFGLLAAAVAPMGAKADGAAALGAYVAGDLAETCRVADSDSREEGRAAEIECEQYVMGFLDALALVAPAGTACPPAENTADEARWAFMRWIYGDYDARIAMPAGAALRDAMVEGFPCK